MIEVLREKANNLPLLPGVYIMKDSRGEVIYVGKAKQLKNRVSSYFKGEHDPKTEAMVSKVADFDVIVTNSELEALVLENSLIKRHQPRYNILLRDDKGYPFIRLDVQSEYPTFTITNKIARDGARYFGPYGGRNVTREIIDTLCKALKLPTCNRKFPRDIGKDRPCLNYHMGACAGYCLEGRSAEEYRRSIREAEMILDGKTDELTRELEEKMMQAAEEMRFELAAEYRDRLRAIAGLRNRQRVIGAAIADTDAVGIFRGAKFCFTVLHYLDGELAGKDYELMEEPLESDAEAISGLVRQYYTIRGAWPSVILLPVEIEDREPLEQLLTQAAGRKVRIETPKRGDRLKLVEAAVLNAREECLRSTTAAQRRLKTLEWLQNTLELPRLPERIEAFDISNLGNDGVVAAMTVFWRGRPLKREYRKFKIKEIEGQDDYHSMQEVLSRRFRRYLEGDEKFGTLPDLLLIDGGAAHAGAAEEVLGELGINLPVFGMVKDHRHRTRGLITAQGNEIGLSGNPAVFALIVNIQEETHRFAIEYQRSLRSVSLGSELDRIKGVGEKRRSALLRQFKTIKAIREATFEELCQAVPRNTAQAVWEHFHGPKDEES
ncbi:MAG: excinuclease ABC subunit UvrC [Oscillospiraceae bacterium]|jgi:excinuclease ABC subunit C